MNNDLISREALKKDFEKVYPLTTNEMGGVVNKRIYEIIDNAPTVAEKPQGEWIEIPVKRDLLYNTGIKYTCSICGKGNCYGKPPFCMYCGAKMKG